MYFFVIETKITMKTVGNASFLQYLAMLGTGCGYPDPHL